MANTLRYLYHLLLLLLLFLSFIHHSNQLQPPQSRSLLLINQLLNYPFPLSTFNTNTDFCNSDYSSSSLTLVCYQDNITQLHIIGNNGLPSLPLNLSPHTLFATLAPLSSLKVLSLVSLGLWGPLPSTIANLSSLEILNVSSNYFSGSIPDQISSLRNLQTLILDCNKFTGQIPDSLTSLNILAVLSLNNNSFSGSLPKSMNFMENLRILSVSNNYLSGEVVDLHNLTNLQVVDLSDNHFGPHFPSFHTKLITLVLRNNSFQFGLPSELASFYQLQRLDISMNGFVGPFLPSLLSLPSINYINISHNRFTGKLFQNMSCNIEIENVDFSSNLLSGELPSCLKLSPNSKMIVLYGSNCLSNHEQKQHPYSFCSNQALAVKPHDKHNYNNKPHGKAIVASTSIGGTIGAIAAFGLAFFVIRRLYTKLTARKPQARLILEKVSSVNTVKLLSDARYISQTMKLGANHPAYRTFALEELKEATNNFDHSNLLGDPSHSEIFRGKLGDGTLVAIRRLTVKKKQSQQSITHQIELISMLRHRHLVSALGHCFDRCLQDDSTITRLFLIFEFVPNGTLRDYTCGLAGKRMNWKRRIGAAIGVAKGIQFLHTVPALYSINLKITDVLLDHDLHVKLSCHNHLPSLAESTRAAAGAALVSSPGPKQNILKREKEDDKKNVYDLGVILAEMLVGRPITIIDEAALVKDLLQVSIRADDAARRSIVDPSVGKECGDNSLKTMMEICLRCLSDEASDRPSVEDILWNLHFAAQVDESHYNFQDSYVSSSHL